jgi:phage/plasmid-associated DNA primase
LDEILNKIPKTYKLLSEILNFENIELNHQYIKLLVTLAILTHYKQVNPGIIYNLQKLIIFTGPGGSGKSLIQN